MKLSDTGNDDKMDCDAAYRLCQQEVISKCDDKGLIFFLRLMRNLIEVVESTQLNFRERIKLEGIMF